MSLDSLPKLPLKPTYASYSATGADNVVSTDLRGGPRIRRSIVNGTRTVNVQFSCDAIQHQVMEAFFQTVTASGSLPFRANLILDNACCCEYKALFVPNSFNLASKTRRKSIYTAQFYVYPQARNVDFDISLSTLYANANGDSKRACTIIESLDAFVDCWPETTPWLQP